MYMYLPCVMYFYQVVQSWSSRIDLGEKDPLTPHTEYVVELEACTSGGCTRGPAVTAKTKPDQPMGMDTPIVSNITTTSMDITWSPPQTPNGPLRK